MNPPAPGSPESLQLVSRTPVADGELRRYQHRSRALGQDLTFEAFVPPQASAGTLVPAVYLWIDANGPTLAELPTTLTRATELGCALIATSLPESTEGVPEPTPAQHYLSIELRRAAEANLYIARDRRGLLGIGSHRGRSLVGALLPDDRSFALLGGVDAIDAVGCDARLPGLLAGAATGCGLVGAPPTM